jgi:signal transduction histidine kinase
MTSALRTSRQETADHIDELNRANKELSDTRDELIRSEKLATVGHLAAGMAHEIGNPLGALTGYLGLLEQEVGEESRELVGRAQGEAGRIDRLVRELLDYAAPGHMSSEPFDALAALREALQLLEEQQAMEGLTLKVTMPESLPETCGSHAKLVQVFLNLLLNARDASLPSGELSVSADQTDDSLVFRIEDNGAGIPTDILPHIFDPFYTTKPQGKGRGLGLAVCYHIVTEMGGRIDVNSQPGHGSCFTIYLPLCGEKKP